MQESRRVARYTVTIKQNEYLCKIGVVETAVLFAGLCLKVQPVDSTTTELSYFIKKHIK